LSLPAIIPAGRSLSFTVTYSPLVAGTDSATLTFDSNGQPSTTTDTSTGTGTPAPVHSVSLSWNASSSSNISGYNIYRAVYVSRLRRLLEDQRCHAEYRYDLYRFRSYRRNELLLRNHCREFQ
jgi:hypothetical protein